jgi:outer membrane protein TolC
MTVMEDLAGRGRTDAGRRRRGLLGRRSSWSGPRQGEGLVRQQIAKEVNQAALMLAVAERSVEASRKGIEQAEEEARVIRERFESRRGIQLELLDAQLTLTRARFNAVNALAEYQTALAMWLRATGRTQ